MYNMGFPSDSAVKNPPAVQELQEMWVWSLDQEDPLEDGMATYSSILARESHGERSLVGYSQCNCKEADMTEATEHTHICNVQSIITFFKWITPF